MDSPETNSRFRPGQRVAVLLPLPLFGAFDYLVPEGLELAAGDWVCVGFGRRELIGVVWGRGLGGVEASRLRPVETRLDARPLPPESMKLIDWVAGYTLYPQGAVLKMTMSVADVFSPPRGNAAWWPTEALEKASLTPARKRVAEIIRNSPPLPATELARLAGCSPSVVRAMGEAGLLRPETVVEIHPPPPDWTKPGPELSPDQTVAATDLEAKAGNGGFSVTLLDGVPGSGKTEVYFQAVAKVLEQGRQVLVLLPEIALTSQWLERFRRRFGADPLLWHSDLGHAERRRNWRMVLEGRGGVVVGARSALFLPFADLGLIVVDEEHEGSFKQEEGVIYNARDMAVVRARIGNIPAVLVSATPSLETVANVRQGRYGELTLPDRHAGAVLPEMAVIDMLKQPPPRGRWLSPVLVQALEQTLADGEQAMLFLNRRGFAPLTLCRACGHRMQCPRCTAWLVEHRGGQGNGGRLICHHCGFALKRPETCPECGAEDSLTPCGPGVERLAAEVAELFPGARHLIAASDSLTGPAAAAEMVRRIEDHQVDLIIGTQIVAKGYHFPMLTLVGVVDADLGLAGGDLRAAERTYQLLYQVAGRAGRGERPGKVLIQTRMPDHPVILALASGDRKRFMEAETEARKQAGMPPFGRLAALIVSGTDEKTVDSASAFLGRRAPRLEGVEVFGPAPAPLALLRGRHRRRLLLKCARDVNVQAVLHAWLAEAPPPKGIRVQVDVDPYGFM